MFLLFASGFFLFVTWLGLAIALPTWSRSLQSLLLNDAAEEVVFGYRSRPCCVSALVFVHEHLHSVEIESFYSRWTVEVCAQR